MEIATSNLCYLGIDDGYFDVGLKKSSKGGETVLVGVVMCGGRFADIFIDRVSVDGLDGTPSAIRIIARSTALHNIRLTFLDGVTCAGFNVIDPRRVYSVLGVPLAVVFRHQLDLTKIFNALKTHFSDYSYRYEVIEHVYGNSFEIRVGNTKIRLYVLGLSATETLNHLERARRVFVEPYPLRMADRLASLLGRVVMYGRHLQ
ncbi:MAG: DUF99 family protein [Ignisphaera sp.]|nr:DUF99 family protein [Ignisphaera sp.]